jgi:hypothetical protein
MPTTKPTSRELFAALQLKFPKAAVLREVSMDDAAEIARNRQYHARTRPRPVSSRYHIPIDESIEVPEDYVPDESVWVRRIDALMFEGKTRTAVEIKISRADFFRDTPAKRAAWQRHTHRFIYLTPRGLVKPEEVPAGCGLWEYDSDTATITSVKRASTNKDVQELPASMSKYFAWRAFAAEQKVARLMANGGRATKGRRTRRHRAG